MEKTNKEQNTKRRFFKLWDKNKDKNILKWAALSIFFVASLIVIYDELRLYTGFYDDYINQQLGESDEDFADEAAEDTCNVSGIELHGSLLTYIPPTDIDADGNLLQDEVASENIIYQIQEEEKDDTVKAIILEIDSYGGLPVAAEEIANFLKQAKKPTVALIRAGGTSAAYWAATGADIIFASKNSDVGSIGITMSYLDNIGKNEKEGLAYNQLSIGKFKDYGDPDKPLTNEEKGLLMRDVEIIYQNFIEAVAENRKMETEEVKKLADGSSMLGQMAMDNGLIDKIGGIAEVKAYLKELIGEDVELCW